MKSIEKIDEAIEILEEKQALLILFADPELLTPADSLIRYFSLNPIAQQLSQSILIYKGIEPKAFQLFQVTHYPQVTVVKQSLTNFQYNFIGNNQEKAWQSLQALAVAMGKNKPHRKINLSKKQCPAMHELQFTNELDPLEFLNGCFICDGCKMYSHAETDKTILICKICDFQLCYKCSHVETIN